jgi:hypothetical protein
LAETSVVEFTAEARLPTPGEEIESGLMLRRIRFGVVTCVPLRCGATLAASVGVYVVTPLTIDDADPFAISCLKSATIMSKAPRANVSASIWLKLAPAS